MIVVAFPRSSGVLHVVRGDVRDDDFTAEFLCTPEGDEAARYQLRGVFRAESLADAAELLTASVCKACRGLYEHPDPE